MEHLAFFLHQTFSKEFNHINNSIVYIYDTPYKVMHLLHAEKTTIIRKQYVWQGFMSFNILFPAGTLPADCNLPSENNILMMSLSSHPLTKEAFFRCLKNG